MSVSSCQITWIRFCLAWSTLGTISIGGQIKTSGSKSLPCVGIMLVDCASLGRLPQWSSWMRIQLGGPFPLAFEVLVGQDLNGVSFQVLTGPGS